MTYKYTYEDKHKHSEQTISKSNITPLKKEQNMVGLLRKKKQQWCVQIKKNQTITDPQSSQFLMNLPILKSIDKLFLFHVSCNFSMVIGLLFK